MTFVSKRFLCWIAAALFVLLGAALPNTARAHDHHAGHATHMAQSSAVAEESGISVHSEPVAQAASVVEEDAASGHCHSACCAPGAGCCAVSCLITDASALPGRANSPAVPRRVSDGPDGIEPSGLIEPPIRAI